jgi:hypothetical protein|tara:strand:+ start:1264 stop:1602 length:339 start_codon:yes stop_codon:yes gene_type:complete
MTENKRITNKQILDKIDALKVGEEGLNALAIKIVTRMMNIQTMSEWYDHVSSSDIAIEIMDKKLNLTEEENSVGDLAKYMTLMELFKDKEEYEKCAICKLKLDNINNILKKY